MRHSRDRNRHPGEHNFVIINGILETEVPMQKPQITHAITKIAADFHFAYLRGMSSEKPT
tara:strand:- start:243 stop:422 length:180 start_codon:yes stop_codon:yes gene_type:complete